MHLPLLLQSKEIVIRPCTFSSICQIVGCLKFNGMHCELVDELFSVEAFLTIPMLWFKWYGLMQPHLCILA